MKSNTILYEVGVKMNLGGKLEIMKNKNFKNAPGFRVFSNN